jgi:hypothetical protein
MTACPALNSFDGWPGFRSELDLNNPCWACDTTVPSWWIDVDSICVDRASSQQSALGWPWFICFELVDVKVK